MDDTVIDPFLDWRKDGLNTWLVDKQIDWLIDRLNGRIACFTSDLCQSPHTGDSLHRSPVAGMTIWPTAHAYSVYRPYGNARIRKRHQYKERSEETSETM